MRVKEIIGHTGGRLLSGSPDADIELSKIVTDSRTIAEGDFFLALKGPRFDGNDFIEEAFSKGAIGAIVTAPSRANGGGRQSRSIGRDKKIIILVRDATKALAAVASAHRKKFRIPVVAVTGSNGKTTVKDMIWSILSERCNCLRNEGTLNNHIGVPQTLLKLCEDHAACVLELGANHHGELRLLSRIARPTICVITNIGPSHLEFFGDLDGVFEAKKEVLESLGRGATAVLNGDDERLSRIRKRAIKVLRFGFRESNDIRAEMIFIKKDRMRFIVNDSMEFDLNLLGIHNVYNALASIAVSARLKVGYRTMKEALSDYRPMRMRLELTNLDGIEIIDDSYNSNPASMKSALEVLKYYPARARWVVTGDMLELGKGEVGFHKMIGGSIAAANVDGLITFGDLSRYTLSEAMRSGMPKERLWHCSTHKDIADILKKVARKGDAVLLKGSRGMRMETVVETLQGTGYRVQGTG